VEILEIGKEERKASQTDKTGNKNIWNWAKIQEGVGQLLRLLVGNRCKAKTIEVVTQEAFIETHANLPRVL
jgi:hypothetical protein